MLPVIIDCDPGHDDAIALLYAARHLDIRGITTVFGNATVAHTTCNALRICELGGIDAPVVAGCAGPLDGAFVPSPIHGETGLDGAADLPAPRRSAAPGHAADLIIAAAAADPGRLSLIATGPLTNVAMALEREPRLAGWLRCISLMGGSTDIGNETAFAEANIFRDPEAADIVFRSGATLLMCGLNLTRQARIGPEIAENLQGAGVPHAVAGMLNFYLARYEQRYGFGDAPMHDPCAVLAVVRPELITWRHLAVAVELHSPLLRGMTVCDLRTIRPLPGETLSVGNVQVGMEIKADAAVAEVFATIASYG